MVKPYTLVICIGAQLIELLGGEFLCSAKQGGHCLRDLGHNVLDIIGHAADQGDPLVSVGTTNSAGFRTRSTAKKYSRKLCRCRTEAEDNWRYQQVSTTTWLTSP